MSVVDWLLAGDPAIRWQALRDLTDAASDVVSTERARVATEGWGAALLGRQTPEGHWGGDPSTAQWSSSPEWTCLVALVWLRDMGLDPDSAAARRAVGLVRERVTWRWWDDNPFFVGEVEPCINGRVAALGAYFGEDSQRVVERLLSEQMADGGWNCEQENGATVGSLHTTINVLEGLLEHERAGRGSGRVAAARQRGEEYLLSRRLLRRLSTDEIIDPDFSRLSFPTGYHYDLLRALDHFRATGSPPDERMAEAIGVIESKRETDGRWRLENPHDDQLDVGTGERDGEPSRWITLRAMRVLRWYQSR